MALVATALATAAAVLLLALAARALRSYLRFRAMEMAIPGPRSLPLLGNLLDMAGVTEEAKLVALQAMWGERRGDISRMALGNHLIVFVTDPDDIGKVLKDRRFAQKPFLYYGFMKPLVGDGLTVNGGDLWRAHRTWVTPAFHADVIDRYVEVFAEEAEALAKQVPLGEAREVVCGFREMTARCALRTGLSSVMRAEDAPAIQALIDGVEPMMSIINTRSFRPWLWPDVVFGLTGSARRLAEYADVSVNFMKGVLARKRQERRQKQPQPELDFNGRPPRKTFIDVIMDSGDAAGARIFTDGEILDESRTFFATSTEISSSALGFIVKVLSVKPDVQDRVVAELREVLGDSGRSVAKEDVDKLTYLECVIKECLRLLPTIPYVAREVTQDTDFNGKTIPAGSTVLVNFFAAHRDPRHHADPLRFDPERFAAGRAAAMHPFSFVPFSGGPRNCIGQRYAMLQMKTILATLLRALRVEAADDGLRDTSDFPLTFDMTLRIIGGIKVRFEPR